jgi:LmbE family N-acetylglucosaminyl deacetylase
MENMLPYEGVIVISPHLDDGVFSCGMLLAASAAAWVVTVFAGMPDAALAAPEWDRRAGFATAAEAMLARRREDRHSLEQLAARPLWLGFLDSQYGVPGRAGDIAAQLASTLQELPTAAVAAPLGLFHSDHILVQQAALALWRESRQQREWLFYEDALYRRLPGLVQQRLAAWREQQIVATPISFHFPELAARKAAAASAYASQLALFAPERLEELRAPERYWRLQCGETG